ncbi:MAG: bifunctional oligoribonuclease/PAP phosphatase NrnA [Terrimicrobiaceae bacterium]
MTTFQTIDEALKKAETILVVSHMRPDADALGSTLAFTLYLQSLGKKVTAWNEDGVCEKFRYLPQHHLLTTPSGKPESFDVVLVLDNSNKKRIGTPLTSIANAGLWINIDHHVSNEKFADLNYVDPTAPATGQILFEYFETLGIPITPDIAENLFAAISTDTGSFQYRGTDGRTFHAASRLVESGVDVAGLSLAMYDSQPKRRLNLLRHALNTARFLCEDRLVTFSLSLADVAELGIVPEDNEGIIDHLRSVDCVVAAVFYEELTDGLVRVSARSKDPRVNVSAICSQFGGGGHPLAAGTRIKGSVAEISEKFNHAVCEAISHGS